MRNIRFVQANGEDLSRWQDEEFDWVQTTMFLHELSGKAMPKLLGETSLERKCRLLFGSGLLVALGGDGHDRDAGVKGRAHVQGLDVEAAAAEQPGHAREHAELVFHENRDGVSHTCC